MRGVLISYVGTCFALSIGVAIYEWDIGGLVMVVFVLFAGFLFLLPLGLFALIVFSVLIKGGSVHWVVAPIVLPALFVATGIVLALIEPDATDQLSLAALSGLIAGVIFWISSFGRIARVRLEH